MAENEPQPEVQKPLPKTHCRYGKELLALVGQEIMPGEVIRHCENPQCDWCARCWRKLRYLHGEKDSGVGK